jgi:hypothetical protein
MSAQANLLQLYKEWRSLTEQEREGIESGNWRQVRQCQSAKSELQPRILRETQETHQEWSRSGADRSLLEKQVRSVVNELIYLESRNGEFIAEQRQRAQSDFDELNKSGRTLGKVHKTYAPNAPIAWESYS